MRLYPQPSFSLASFKMRSCSSLRPLSRRRRGRRPYAAHLPRTNSRCQRSRVSDLGRSDRQSGLGRTRLSAASTRRSVGCQRGRPGAPTPRAGDAGPRPRPEAWPRTGCARSGSPARNGLPRRGRSTARPRKYRRARRGRAGLPCKAWNKRGAARRRAPFRQLRVDDTGNFGLTQ
jgi:hypothetical protein